MNVRIPVNYSAMFAVLDTLMAADLPQMELYCEIGRLVSGRPEKGSAVAAAEYLCAAYPDTFGFSPRNLRRMREFYRAYESAPEVLAEAMTIGWTQNVVILEAELILQERAWYIKAAGQFGWSKLELAGNIRERIHENMALDNTSDPCYSNGSGGGAGGEEKFPGHFCKVCGMRKSNESFSGRGHAVHICKACFRLSPARQAEEMTLRRPENLPLRRLSESEMTWLKNRTHDHRPDVKSLTCMVYTQRFPRQIRNQKKQELSIQTLKLTRSAILMATWYTSKRAIRSAEYRQPLSASSRIAHLRQYHRHPKSWQSF